MLAADGVLVLVADPGGTPVEVDAVLACVRDAGGVLACTVAPLTEGRPRPVPAAVAVWLGDLAAAWGRPRPGAGQAGSTSRPAAR